MYKKVKQHKNFDIITIMPYILIAVALILTVVILTVTIASKKSKQLDNDKLTPLNVSADSDYILLGDGIAYIDGGNVYYVDDRGELMWGYSGVVELSQMVSSKNHLGMFVGKKLQVISVSGASVFSKEFDSNISSVAMGEKLIVIKLSDSDDTVILNYTGEEIDRITSGTNCTNIRYGVYGESSVWVITVENSGFAPQYMLSTYKYDSGKTQTITFQDDSQMIYNASFSDNLCYIIGTERIMVRDCDYTGSVNYDYNVNGYDVVSSGIIGKSLHMLLINNGIVKAIGNKNSFNLACPEELSFAVVSKKYYYGFSKYFMYRFSVDGKKCVRYGFPLRIDNLVSANGYCIIESDGMLYRMNIPD